jgi:hypothetical protein
MTTVFTDESSAVELNSLLPLGDDGATVCRDHVLNWLDSQR